MKSAIIYHSESGNTAHVAEAIAGGILSVSDCEVRSFSVDKVDSEWIAESKLVIFGSPTYAGTCSWQMKQFLDTTDITLAGKLGTVFATENYFGGGADLAEICMIAAMLVRGMLVFSGGAALGQPYTHFGAVVQKKGNDEQIERAKILGIRLAEKAKELFAK